MAAEEQRRDRRSWRAPKGRDIFLIGLPLDQGRSKIDVGRILDCIPGQAVEKPPNSNQARIIHELRRESA